VDGGSSVRPGSSWSTTLVDGTMLRPVKGRNDPGCRDVPGRVRSVQPSPSTRPRVRWGVWDFVLAFVAGAIVGGIAAALVTTGTKLTATSIVVSIVAQEATIIAYLVWASRAKGLGSLERDFGLVVHPGDAGWFFGGVGIQVLGFAPIALLSAVYGHEAQQDVVKAIKHASGPMILLVVLSVGVLAPVTEELLFRGVLLRALLRRFSPDQAVFLSAVVFGVVHVLGDPSVGSLIALPMIIVLGVVSGYQAVKTGNLSRSIMLHMGFTALTVVLLFA